MTTHPVRLVLALSLLAAPAVAAAATINSTSSAVVAAEYCVNKGATYVEGKEVLPAGQYCVPGP
jgi:hypothetical protein